MIRIRRYRFFLVLTFFLFVFVYNLATNRPDASSVARFRIFYNADSSGQGDRGQRLPVRPARPPVPSERPIPQIHSDSDPFSAGEPETPALGHSDPAPPSEPAFPTLTASPRPTKVQWINRPDKFPVSSTIALPTGSPLPLRRIQHVFKPESALQRRDRLAKAAEVRKVFKRTWDAYATRCLGSDELRPVSGECRDTFNGWGATLVDSLDTLWLLGFRDEFDRAVGAVQKIDFTVSESDQIPLFETTIRYLGGLVGAYDVSDHKYPLLLQKAVELADVLMGAFDTPNRMPVAAYRWRPDADGRYVLQAPRNIVLAELGTLSLEFTRLAQLTGNDRYYDAVARVTNELELFQNQTRLPGLWPIHIDVSGCKRDLSMPFSSPSYPISLPDGGGGGVVAPRGDSGAKEEDNGATGLDPSLYSKQSFREGKDSAQRDRAARFTIPTLNREQCLPQGLAHTSAFGLEEYTLGAMTDSAYEYLPKQHVLLGGQLDQYQTMYERASATVKQHVLFRPMLPQNDDVLISGSYFVNTNGRTPTGSLRGKNSHLTCFVGGMFAMAGRLFGQDEDVEIGAKLTDGCIWSYMSTPTGIMPEEMTVIPCELPTECRWNETLYHEYLDPNYEYREDSYRRLLAEYEHEQEQGRMRTQPENSKENEPGNSAVVASKDGSSPRPRPRRRHGAAVSPVPSKFEQFVEPISVPPSPPPGSWDDTNKPKDDRVFTQTPGTADGLSHPPGHTRPPPSPPQSREQYAKQRILTEGLPPGYLSIDDRRYLLRPEALESVFYMYRITGDHKYRKAGWTMFQSIVKHTQTELAYSSIHDVIGKSADRFGDEMESFWTAETLKYAYLLFADEDVLSLDSWVFNTEAHPFRRPT